MQKGTNASGNTRRGLVPFCYISRMKKKLSIKAIKVIIKVQDYMKDYTFLKSLERTKADGERMGKNN